MSNYISNLSNKSYNYSYFRIFVPTDLQIRFEDKHDFRLSLRYVRKEDTQILCLKLKQITDLLFTDIRNGMKILSLDDIKEILRIEVRKQIKHTQHFYLGTNVFDTEDTIKSLELVSTRETKMKEDLSGENIKDYRKELDKKLDGILSSLDIEIETNSINYKNLRRQFIQLYTLRSDWIKTIINETGKVEEDDFRREVDEKLGISLFPNLKSQTDILHSYEVKSQSIENKYNSVGSTTPLTSLLQSTPISKCIEQYFGERKGMRERSVQQNRTSLNFLIHSFGDIPIGEITKEKSSILKSQIKQLPKNRTKNPKYREKDFHELLDMKIPDKDIIHTTTINKYISSLSSFML